ncbi:helix-turn-helix domain-containing protein [Nonomuraea sp. SMC257]|uniref:Helix-turn-helix domain-containing protein n=1 Tax=Nonomuraea montanisoli TaxID=2741721 RepID=A0A7Y6M2N1_9ACTN|nr:helix-turn-helix domain-containing protein [Nonomuraea montanisoli]NUW32342.1 helix-turn-helix domain-containing protein [Nonomuraea montanisoli]
MTFNGTSSPVSVGGAGIGDPSTVRIDRDVMPAWETNALPPWVVNWLIPMLSAGQKWPEASESGLSKLCQAYEDLGKGVTGCTPRAGAAARTIVTGWSAPATANFLTRAKFLYGHEGGMTGVARNSTAYAQQASNFAVETQYSKLSINVAFWVTVVAIAIAIIVNFFTAGSSTALIGPAAAGARAAISRILVRLAIAGSRPITATQLARVSTLSGATGPGLISRVLATEFGHELVEEIGEEFFIDAVAQYQQIKMGTRKEWDFDRSMAAILGAGGGAIVGMKVAGPVSRVTGRVPGFAGRALTTGVTNTIASPVGSFIANGLVYGQWENPFTYDSMTGGFFGGAGRTGSISPFNPSVASAVIHPLTTLASAYDLAARADAARAAGGPPGGSPDGSPVGGGPGTGGGPGSGGGHQGGLVSVPQPAAAGAPRAAGSAPHAPAMAGAGPSATGRSDGDGRGAVAPDPGGSGARHGSASRAHPAQAHQAQAHPAQADAQSSQTGASPEPGESAHRPSGRGGASGQGQTGTAPQSSPDTAQPLSPESPDSGEGTGRRAADGQTQGRGDAAPQPDHPTARPDGQPAHASGAASPAGPTATGDQSATPQPAQHAQQTDPAGHGAGNTAASSAGQAAAITAQAAAERARTALIGALATDFSNAVIGPTGDLLITSDSGVRMIPAATMNRLRAALDTRAQEVTNTADLQAEATAMLTVAQEGETPAPSTAPGQGAPAAAAPASRPGTVTSRPVPGTRHVPDGRQGPDLTLDEVHRALSELHPRHFLDEEVTGFTWLEAGRLLAVRTKSNGTFYFRPVIGWTDVASALLSHRSRLGLGQEEVANGAGLSVGEYARLEEGRGRRPSTRTLTALSQALSLTDNETAALLRIADEGGMSPGLMGETRIRTGTRSDPHLVHFGPRIGEGQVSRVWLHEITDTLQEVLAGDERGRRRILPHRRGENTRDMCVHAQLNELELLADKWRKASTPAEQRRLAVDFDGVSRQLLERGQNPPPPPWAPTPGTRTQQAASLPRKDPQIHHIEDVIDALVKAEDALRRQIQAKTRSAEEAKEQARKATREARKAAKQHDQGRFTRARKERQKNRSLRAARARKLRIAAAYRAALTEATQARETYEQLLMAMKQPSAATRPGEVGMGHIARSLEAKARRQHQGYLDALAVALPQEISLSAALPTGRLPHLTKLTATVNKMLADNKSDYTFTPLELEQALRADFHKAVSPDGVVLRVGRGPSAAQVRVKLTLSDLAEVIDPAIKGSEMMVGLFFQSGRTATNTESSSAGVSAGFSTTALAPMMAEGEMARNLVEMLGVSVGASVGRGSSASVGAGAFAQGGYVADDRSEPLLFDADASWRVEVRTSKSGGWSDSVTVASGAPGDATAQRLWLSQSYADQPPRKLARIDEAKRDPKFPRHVLAYMTGLEGGLDAVAAALGGDYTQVGAPAHDQLRTFITEELPLQLREAVNGTYERVLTRNGQPHARVIADSRVVRVRCEPLGGANAEEWEEEVLTDFVALPGGASSGRSVEGNASAGLKTPGLADVNGPGDYRPTIGPRVRGSRSVSQSYSATASKQAIHPSVHRKTSPKQSYKLVVETTFWVEVFGKPPVKLQPVRSTAVVGMRESAAYRYGLPVDSAALVYKDGRPLLDADGNQVLRGDPRPGPPPGRKDALPVWLGDGPGQMRGAGPALVGEITGLDEFRRKVLDELAKRGIIPKTVDGRPQYASNALERASQILNEQEVKEQLSEHRIRAAYDSLAQDGIRLDLTLQGLNGAKQEYTLHLSLKQVFTERTPFKHTDSETVVNLDIGSDTSARGVSRSRTYAGGASISESDGPDQGHDGLTHEVGANGGGNRTRTVGSSDGTTDNVVGLNESGDLVATTMLGHDLIGALEHNGETTMLAKERGQAELKFAADLLPEENGSAPAPLGKLSEKARSKLLILHMDVPGSHEAARRVAPRGMRAGSRALQIVTALLNVRNLVSHTKLFTRAVTAALGSSAENLASRSSLSVEGELGEAEVIAAVDHVNGDILFGLGSAGVSWGGSSGVSVGTSVSASDLDDGGTSSDGAAVSLPSRSGGTSDSTSILDIWGNEELTIKYGRQYIIRASATLTFTGSETATHAQRSSRGGVSYGETRTETAQGTVLGMIAEYEALQMYIDGELKLPGALVADAVERFLNHSLDLDPSVAVPLVQRYVKDVAKARKAGADVSYAARHTPQVLLARVKEVMGIAPDPAAQHGRRRGNPEKALKRTLSAAADLLARSQDVVLAPSHDRALGTSTVESLDVTEKRGWNWQRGKPRKRGKPVSMMDAVTRAVNNAIPGAVEGSPTLAEELAVNFSDKAARVHVLDMWSARGYEKSYHVQGTTPGSQTEEVTVRARLVPADPKNPRRAKFLSHTNEAGTIIQRYRYTDRTHSRSYNGSYAVGVDYNTSDASNGYGGGVSTDRGRSYTSSINRQSARLNRIGLFNGLDRVRQDMVLVIEVERRPVRGRVRGHVHRVTGKLRRRFRRARPVTFRAALTRYLPTGMIRPASEDPGPLQTVPDPRRVELLPGQFPSSIWEDPDRPSLYDVIVAQLTKMTGATAVDEIRPELVRRLLPSSLLTAFERMAEPAGEVLVRTARQGFRSQGTEVNVKAHLSDLTVVSGPFEAEIGEVDRAADAQNATVSRSHVLPIGMGGSAKDNQTGLDGGVRVGEQASESVSDHHGGRRERSMFRKGPAYVVRLRVDYDLTFQNVARLRDGREHPVGKPIHLPGATGGEVDVVLFADELADLQARMEANARVAPPDTGRRTFRFVPEPGREGMIDALRDARLAARERGEVAVVAVRDKYGLHRYHAHPDGSLRSMTTDGWFAEAFATLPPLVLEAASAFGLDLREVYLTSDEPGTFTHQVKAALMARGVLAVDDRKPDWPAERRLTSQPVGGSVSQGVTAPSVTSPAIEGTPFSRSARPASVPDLTVAEVRAQAVAAADLGGGAARITWATGDTMTVQVPAGPDQHVRVLMEDPGEGLNAAVEPRAGTADDPHVIRMGARIHPEVVSSVLVHELSHVLQEASAVAAGAPQGVVRTSLAQEQAEGTDHCLLPRLNEHAHLSDKWRAATDRATRALLADAIDAIAADIGRRGHTPPAPPWGTGPRAPVPAEPQSRIARLLSGGTATGLDTSPAGLSKVAAIAGVADVSPVPGQVKQFTVTTAGGRFTLELVEAARDATEVSVEARTRDRLTLRVPAEGGPRVTAAVAEQVAGHAAILAGRSGERLLGPGPVVSPRALGVPDAMTLARLRGLAQVISEAGPRGAAAARSALRAEMSRAGLAPGQDGAAARLLALARSGQLSPTDVAAIRGGETLPETAAAAAIARAAALMGARVQVLGPGLLDIVIPGRPPIPVEVRPERAGAPEPGVLTYQLDGRLTIGANERAAAATAAAAVARARGGHPGHHAALAELHEAVRQARAATTTQRPGRLGVLFDLLTTAPAEVWRLLPEPVAAELAELRNGKRPRDWPAYLKRLRMLANTTGWWPPEEPEEPEQPGPAEAPSEERVIAV